MTPAEQKRLAFLLGKLLNQAHQGGKPALIHHTWKVLYALGANVVDQGDEFWVLTSS